MNYLAPLRFEGGAQYSGIWQLHHALSLIQEPGQEQNRRSCPFLKRRLRAAIAHCGLDVLPTGEKLGMVIPGTPGTCSQAREFEKVKIQ